MQRTHPTLHIALLLSTALSLSVALLTAQAETTTQTLVIVADPWCPFNCQQDSTQQGFMIDIAREALALSGITIDYQITNWARAKLMVQNGEADGIVGMARDQNNEKHYRFPSTPLGNSQVCFYRKAGSKWTFTGIASLDSIRFGWINDYGFNSPEGMDDWIKAHRHTKQVLPVSGDNTHARLFKLMLSDRIDTFAEDRNVIAYELMRSDLSREIQVAGCAKSIDQVYLAFHKHAPHSAVWADALDAGVTQLKENGRQAEILAAYGLTLSDWIGSDQ